MANLNYNKVILGGRLARDVGAKDTQSGKKVASFCVAVSRQKDTTDFINCTAWEKTAELVSTYFHKGSSILVEGELQTREYTDKEGKKRTATEVLVRNAHFVDSRAESEGVAPATAPTAAPAQSDYMADRYAQIGAQAQQAPQTVPMYEQLSDSDELPF